jgi:hypothetical protein
MKRALEVRLVEVVESLRAMDDALRSRRRACATVAERKALEAEAKRVLAMVDRMTALLEEL